VARDQKSGATGCLARVAVAECKLEHPDGQNTGMPEGPQVPFRAGVSSLPMSKDDAGVDASEAESIRNRVLYHHAPGLPGDEATPSAAASRFSRLRVGGARFGRVTRGS
jgi:hypothetical protein